MRDAETVVGALAGLVLGYILWLVGVSIGVDSTTTARWSVTLIVVSIGVGLLAAWVGWRLRRRRHNPWAAFLFGLPILPVVLSLCVLTVAYV